MKVPWKKGPLMSAPFRPYNPDQALLLPPSLKEWLPEGHLASFLLDVVRELDLSAIYAHYDFEENHDEKGQVVGHRAKSNRGSPAYEPRMMTGLLLYGYVTGVTSSRAIERKCIEDVAFRVLSGDQKPDHDTVASYRRIHLLALEGLFLQVLRLCQEAGLVKLGHVALDGTKVKANASKHKAMSYGRMKEKEPELARQVRELLARAEATDQEEDQRYGKGKRGDELPEALARRQTRLAKIREAKAALEAEAKAEAQKRRQEEEEDRRKREEEGKGKKSGKPIQIREEPEDRAQRNFTDPESRIMVDGQKAYIQGYNAQAAVDHEKQVIVACDVVNMAPDQPQLVGMLDKVEANMGRKPEELSADAGYFSEANVQELADRKIDPLVAAQRQRHGERAEVSQKPPPRGTRWKERMIHKLSTETGRRRYALRKVTVEPVFGQIKTRGLVRFWLRGLEKARGEWALWCLSHNLLKLWRYGDWKAATG